MASNTDNLKLALSIAGVNEVVGGLKRVAHEGTTLNKAFYGIGMGIGVAAGAIVKLGMASMEAARGEEILAAKMRAVFGKGAGEQALRWAESLSMGMGAAVGDADELAATMMRLRQLGLNPSGLMEPIINTTAATGASMETLAQAFGKVQQQGMLSSRTVLQFISAGIPISDILQKKLGLSVEQLKAMGKSGVDAARAIPAIAAGLQDLYGGAAAEQAESIQGTMRRIANTFNETLETIGASIWPTIKPWLEKIRAWFADPKNLDTIFAFVAKLIAGFRLAGDVIGGMMNQLFTDRGIPPWLSKIETELLNMAGYALTIYTTMQGIQMGAKKGPAGALIGGGAGFVVGSATHMTAIDKLIAGVKARTDNSPHALGGPRDYRAAYNQYNKSAYDELIKNRPGLTSPLNPKALGPASNPVMQAAQAVSAGVQKAVEQVIIGGASRARGGVKAMDLGGVYSPTIKRPRVDIHWHSDGKGGNIDTAVQKKAETVVKETIIQLVRQGWGPQPQPAR